jgi:hypothetical protein
VQLIRAPLVACAVLGAWAPAHARPSRTAAAPLVVPQVGSAPRIDGELAETAWHSPARTGPFVDDKGETAAPYSEARFLRDDRFLYLGLYAADEDIRVDDEFVVELDAPKHHLAWHFTAGGKITPEIAGASAAADTDGTIGDPRDDDEEWAVEAAIPLSAVPFGADGAVAMRITRCDVTKDRVRRCGAWSGRLAIR